jgi:predicted metal-dependent hydrolase
MRKTLPDREFRRRVAEWAQRLRCQPRQVVVMKMTRKWGSCSNKGRVCFARGVLALPTKLRDYIVVHELLHLRYPNHGRLFRAVLGATLPNWREMHGELREWNPQRPAI